MDKIERVDQRDTAQSRTVLRPGTPECEDYYKRHPEHKGWDDRCREVLSKATKRHFESDPLGVQLQPNVFYTRHILGAPEIVEGKAEETYLWEKPEEIPIERLDNTKFRVPGSPGMKPKRDVKMK